MTQSKRLQKDVEDLISSIRHTVQTTNGFSELSRHTHSLKTLALQGGFPLAGESIHRLEALLLLNDRESAQKGSIGGIEEELQILSKSFEGKEIVRDEGFPQSESNFVEGKCPTFRDLYLGLSSEEKDHVSRLLSRGYVFYTLIYQGSPGKTDILGLRFQNLQSKIEKEVGVLITLQSGVFFGLGALGLPNQKFVAPVALIRLISQDEIGYERFLFLETAIDLDGPQGEGTENPFEFLSFRNDIAEFSKTIATDQGKFVHTTVYGELELPAHTGDTLKGLLFQGLRNAITHGIEKPDERKFLGKQETGVIDLCFTLMPDTLLVTLEDDGRGMVQESQTSKPNESSNEWSGRGLGIPMMRWYGEKLLGGTVSFLSHPGAGTRIEIALSREIRDFWGLSALSGNSPVFVPFFHIYGYLANIGEYRPSRLGKEWYCTYKHKNFPLRTLVARDNDALGWEDVHVYSEDMDDAVGLLIRYQSTYGILLLSRVLGREVVARGPLSPKVYSQALKTDAMIFPF
ncbi:MAG: hypothetical protein GW949_01115 [Spirochaetales bacterium]|nr:hypothetical protein [Spirochaetales bacterium]